MPALDAFTPPAPYVVTFRTPYLLEYRAPLKTRRGWRRYVYARLIDGLAYAEHGSGYVTRHATLAEAVAALADEVA